MKKMLQLKLCLNVMLFFWCILFSALALPSSPGVIDLTQKSFDNNKIHDLNGVWHFYWKNFLLQPEDALSAPYEIRVPGTWENDLIHSESLPALGFGTLYTVVQLPDDRPDKLAIKIRRVKMAHRMYVNGELVSQVGEPDSSPTHIRSGHRPDIAYIQLASSVNQLNIALQVANFSYVKGGPSQSIKIGSYNAINTRKNENLAKDFSLFGALFIIALYHLVIWLKRRGDTSTLYFGLFCVGIAFRQLVTGEKFFLHLFPSTSTELMLTMEYASIFWCIPILHLFVERVFPEEFHHLFKKLSIAALALEIFISLSLPLYWQSYLIPFHELYIVLVLIHIFYVGLISAKNQKKGSHLFLVGILIFFVFSINDILYERGIINTAFTARWGAMFFVFIQASILSIRFSNAFSELEGLKLSLEDKVRQRTQELENARDHSQIVVEENRRLSEHTNHLLEDERKLIAREIHDSFNSTLITIKLHLETIRRVSKDTEILDIATSLSNVISSKYELARDLVRRLRPEVLDTMGLKGAIENLVNTLNISSDIQFSCSVDGNIDLLSEDLTLVLYRIIQEGTTNAIKYSDASAAIITLYIDNKLTLSMSDDGVGFDIQKIGEGEGLGLISIRERLVSFGGTLQIHTSPESGTSLIITVPLNS